MVRLALALLVLCVPPALAQDDGIEVSEDAPEPPKTIDKTIAAGLRRLRSLKLQEPPEGVALEAFVLYTRAICGDLRKEDREKLTAWNEDWKRDERHEGFGTPNDLAATVLALAAANADPKAKPPPRSENPNRPPRGSRFDKDHWKLMHACIVGLLADPLRPRNRDGGWGLSGSDPATTHLVLLALRDAARAGYPVPADAFDDALRFLRTAPEKGALDAATRRGGTWICRERLGMIGDAKQAVPPWMQQMLEQPTALDTVFRDKDNAPAIDCLWVIEHLGSMTGQAEIGGGNWYREGTNRILAAKWLDQPLESPEQVSSVCYAILFLKRPTAPLAAGK